MSKPYYVVTVFDKVVSLSSILLLVVFLWTAQPIDKFATSDVYASVNEDTKFDVGFYQKIKNLANQTGGVSGASMQYHDVIVVVSRDNGDDRDPDEVARENKVAIVKQLNLINAQNIAAAESLSFVTASIPVESIVDLAQSSEVFRLGDGEILIQPSLTTTRQTTHSEDNELVWNGNALDGSGITVGILEGNIDNHAINHISLTNAVTKRVSCNFNGCVDASQNSNTVTNHRTQVAQIIASSGSDSNGIAPGVRLLDIMAPDTTLAMVHSLDWALKNGADIVNNSWAIGSNSTEASCDGSLVDTSNLIVNETVDKGMFMVQAAGNDGERTTIFDTHYRTIRNPGCAHNNITVGGINDRGDTNMMFIHSSRGPASDEIPILLPEIVAPAFELELFKHVNSNEISRNDIDGIGNTNIQLSSGTSFAAPQVSATAALMLQARPDLTPIEVKAGILLGADWQGPTPCTSTQYEQNVPSDNCSYARQIEDDADMRNNNASLQILNNVGFGILDVAQTLEYIQTSNNHVIRDHLSTSDTTHRYTFEVTDTTALVKVILSWLVQPHGGIIEQTSRDYPVSIADLNFRVLDPNDTIVQEATSSHQTNEFVVFTPATTGTYTIIVEGNRLNTILKPVQNYALASTNPLTQISTTSTNQPPIAQKRTIIIDPNNIQSIPIRLFGTDPNNDSISFSVSQNPSFGTVSTAESITNTISRVFYTPSGTKALNDSFMVTPRDGLVTGTSAAINLKQENLPSFISITASSDNIAYWNTLHITNNFRYGDNSETFTPPSYPISALYVGSENMEGVSMKFTATISTTSGINTYNIAIPDSGVRMIEFVEPMEDEPMTIRPITIHSMTLSYDGIDEEATYNSINPSGIIDFAPPPDIRVFVGHVRACPQSGASGTVGTNSCTATEYNYAAHSSARLQIPDNTDTLSVTDTINVRTRGTIEDIFVTLDIAHTSIGDLKVTLTSPAGTQVTLHNRSGGSASNIQQTYAATLPDLVALRDTQMLGIWTLSIGDYNLGDIGTLNRWGLDINYAAPPIVPPPSLLPQTPTTVFHDTFDFLTQWTETGEGDWVLSTSRTHYAPTLSGHMRNNSVLHVDECLTECIITMRDSIDLTPYESVTLEFDRFVDRSLDNGEYLKMELYNGSAWIQVSNWTNRAGDSNVWERESVDLSSYTNTRDFEIRFLAKMDRTNEDAQIDNIRITGTRAPVNPLAPDTTPPVITLSGDNPLTIERGSTYSDPGAITDDDSTIRTSNTININTVGVYRITYQATDDAGNQAVPQTRIVNVVDTTPPVITLLGDNPLTIERGSTYSDPGAITDDGSTVVTSGTVKASSRGTYRIIYDATDAYGNRAEFVVRTVNVIIPPPPSTPPPPPPPAGTIAFSDDFESSSFTSKWSESGDGDWRIDTSSRHSVPTLPSHDRSNRVLHVDDCDSSCVMTLRSPLNLSIYRSATLTFDRFVDHGIDPGEYLRVELYNGRSWSQIYNWTHGAGDDNRWHGESYDLSGYLVSGFQMRLVARASATSEDIQIDNIRIVGTRGTPPSIPPPTTPPSIPPPTFGTVAFLDNFETSSFTSKWSERGDGDWRIDTSGNQGISSLPGYPLSNRVLHIDDCDNLCTMLLRPSVNLSGYSSATLTFDRFVSDGLDNGEYLKVELYDGRSWNQIYYWTHGAGDDNRWHSESRDLSDYLISGFQIRLTARMSYFNEEVQLDNIKIEGTLGTPPPSTPSQPPQNTGYSVYVADTDDSEILVHSQSGTHVFTFSSTSLGRPWDIAFGPDNYMYVSDNIDSKIRKYSVSTVTNTGTGSDPNWVSTQGYPHGLTWHNNILYVATQMGIERFSLSGNSYGLFGDATRNPLNSQAPGLFNTRDVTFCSDNRMYVGDLNHGILVYTSSGRYLKTISGDSANPPNTRHVAGVYCGSAITGSGQSLYQSGDDGGRINEITAVNGSLKTSFRHLVDEPFGMDMDPSGSLYIANKDDDNVLKITSSGVTSIFASTRFDDPRGVVIGPHYTGVSGATDGGAAGSGDSDTPNDPPEFELLFDGEVLDTSFAAASDFSLDVRATDAEGDPITIELNPDTVPEDAISITDNLDGTAEISITVSDLEPDTYIFWVIAQDDQGKLDRKPYLMLVP